MTPFRKRLLPVFLLSFAWLGCLAQFDGVFELAEQLHDPPKNTGLVIGLVAGKQSDIRGFGNKSATDPTAPTAADLFEIGGLSTTITSMLMLASRADGPFFLEQAVEDYLPEQVKVPHYLHYRCVELSVADNTGRPKRVITCSPEPGSSPICITFCDLSTHTSGLPLSLPQGFNWNPFVDDRKWQALETGLDQQHWLEQLPNVKLKSPPGTEFRYSNLGAALLGYSLEQIHGISYDEMISRWLSKPFGLPQTKAVSTVGHTGATLPGHDYKGREAKPFQTPALIPAAGLLSSADDLVRMLSVMLHPANPEIEDLVGEALQERVDVTFPTAPEGTLVGYGWLSSPLKPGKTRRIYWQYGGTAGYRAFVGLVPDTDTGIVLLANSSEPIMELAFELINALQPSKEGKIKK